MPGKNLRLLAKDKFDYTVFLFVSAIGAVLGAFSVAIDFLVPSPNNSNLDTLGLIYFGGIFLFAKIQRVYKPFVYPTLVILFVISPAYWIESGGLSIIGVLVYIAAIVMCIFIAPLVARKYVMTAFLSMTILYPAFDTIKSLTDGAFDSFKSSTYLYFIFISVGIQYATAFIKISFERERSSIKDFGQSLRELHRLNMTEWESIEETFRDYVETGTQLLGAQIVIITKKEWNRWRVIEGRGFEWEDRLQAFDDSYKSKLGQIRTTEFFYGEELPFFQEMGGSLLVVPIHVEGLFFGHFVLAGDLPLKNLRIISWSLLN